ncbi:HAD family hydrolase [Floccifex sp.]|uniref:HAD family hydrolase n=1 Tax=Floccifex sp. TaxID=2815810 RepID=UPI002A74E923|nr:HAD family hydrolase [Floccifex sp.]MDD7281764.1 HAD family hydrolase [Erysipelotrichaceae bacterium]MDY2958994.1 HAD family hydrolase [Floccifex sp.]
MKIIFLDADGTLFDHSGLIPHSTKEAIALAQAKGHKVCLCTGRQRCEIFGELLKIPFDGIVCGSGATIYTSQKDLLDIYFDSKQINELLAFIKTNNIPVLLESSSTIFVNEIAKKRLVELEKQYCSHLPEKEKIKNTVYVLCHQSIVLSYEELSKQNINKVTFIESHLSYQQIENEFKDNYDLVPATFAPLGSQSGEISNKAVTKGTGMKTLIDYFKLTKNDVISIGDGFNDLPMFDQSHISIAMGNAPQEVKEYCDDVTTSLLNDGIYNAFKKYELI